MPRFAPLTKVANCRRLGAEVILEGNHIAEARQHAEHRLQARDDRGLRPTQRGEAQQGQEALIRAEESGELRKRDIDDALLRIEGMIDKYTLPYAEPTAKAAVAAACGQAETGAVSALKRPPPSLWKSDTPAGPEASRSGSPSLS